jgi:hypothetical protein
MTCFFDTKEVGLDDCTWQTIEEFIKKTFAEAGREVPDKLVSLTLSKDDGWTRSLSELTLASETDTKRLDDEQTNAHATAAVQSVSSTYYYCKKLSTGKKYWYRCRILDGTETCSNTGIRCD